MDIPANTDTRSSVNKYRQYESQDLRNRIRDNVQGVEPEAFEPEVIERIIEVPKVTEEIVEKEIVITEPQYVEVVKEIPQVQEVVKRVPKYEIQEVIREVPKIEVKYREKIVEVPQLQVSEALVCSKLLSAPLVEVITFVLVLLIE